MRLKALAVGVATLGAIALTSGSVSAMPNGMPEADRVAGQTANVEQARWVCNAFGRCFWRPNWYGAYGYYGYHRPWGGHRW